MQIVCVDMGLSQNFPLSLISDSIFEPRIHEDHSPIIGTRRTHHRAVSSNLMTILPTVRFDLLGVRGC